MEKYKERIENAIHLIEDEVEKIKLRNLNLTTQVNILQQDNISLREALESAISKIDNYILELENIRRNYGNHNDNN